MVSERNIWKMVDSNHLRSYKSGNVRWVKDPLNVLLSAHEPLRVVSWLSHCFTISPSYNYDVWEVSLAVNLDLSREEIKNSLARL